MGVAGTVNLANFAAVPLSSLVSELVELVREWRSTDRPRLCALVTGLVSLGVEVLPARLDGKRFIELARFNVVDLLSLGVLVSTLTERLDVCLLSTERPVVCLLSTERLVAGLFSTEPLVAGLLSTETFVAVLLSTERLFQKRNLD